MNALEVILVNRADPKRFVGSVDEEVIQSRRIPAEISHDAGHGVQRNKSASVTFGSLGPNR